MLCDSILNAIRNAVRYNCWTNKDFDVWRVTKAMECIKLILGYYNSEENDSVEFLDFKTTFKTLKIKEVVTEFVENFDHKNIYHPNSEIRQLSEDILMLLEKTSYDSDEYFAYQSSLMRF